MALDAHILDHQTRCNTPHLTGQFQRQNSKKAGLPHRRTKAYSHGPRAQAGVFYAVHAERPFYDELCEFMASEAVYFVQVL